MASLIAAGFLTLTAAVTISKILAWRKAYDVAKSTKFATFVSPIHYASTWWLVFHPFLLPVLNLLPRTWKTPWLLISQRWSIWKSGHKPFEDAGSDTFVLATPQGPLLWTCDPKICSELERQHPDSRVAVEITKIFNVYGPTIGTVEADEWKMHRKVITSGFNGETYANVWKETTQQVTSLVDHWLGQDGVVPVVKHWTSRLALHVISAVFFRRNLKWTDYENELEHPPPGHQLTYGQALFTVLASLGPLFLTPKALLGRIPTRRFRELSVAFSEWTKYMQELHRETVNRLDEIGSKKNKSLLEAIVLAGTPSPNSADGDHPLPEESIIGNIFFTLLAGHETTGNTLGFTFILLALFPNYQRKIQYDLDTALRAHPWAEWTVECDYHRLQKEWLGAFQKEVLRAYGVVQMVPRKVVAPITVKDSEGETHVIPADTLCVMDFSAAFRNPRTWNRKGAAAVSATRRAELHNSPVLDFDPERWVESGDVTAAAEGAPLFFPFGQGPHLCPGRLFAQVEMTAAVATVLKDFDIELVVDEEVTQKNGDDDNNDGKLAWERTRDRAMRMLIDEVDVNINIQLVKELPIKIVRRS